MNMENIDLEAKLKALEEELDVEIIKKNEEQNRIWEEFTGRSANNSSYSTYPVNKASGVNGISGEANGSGADGTGRANTEAEHITMDMLNEPVVTKDDFKEHAKWAITLAGGGGRGSYHIGVWKALKELKLMEDVIAVSGSSSGALDAALISIGDYENAENIWRNIIPEQFLDINDSVITGPVLTLLDRTKSDGICSREGLIKLFESLPLDKLLTSQIPAYISVAWYTNDTLECINETPAAEYVCLAEVDTSDAKQLLLASSAMPYIYPPEIIHGRVYRDGGLADNVPIMPITNVGADKLIVVKLDPNNKINRELYSHFNEVIEITPSRNIGSLIDGTLDFDGKNAHFRMLLGYYDTLRAFSLRMYEKNKLPLSEAEIRRREEEDYEKVMSQIRRERAISSANSNINKLNDLLGKM